MIDTRARPVDEQNIGDCTLNALTQLCEITSGEGIDYSRRFALEEGQRQDGELAMGVTFHGMAVRTAVSALNRIGLCAESLCPYDWPVGKQPDPSAFADAETRIGWWELEQLTDADAIDEALARPNTGVIISFGIGAEWTNAKADSVLDRHPAYEAGHAAVLCFREADGTYRLLNSWGPNWADRGTVRVTRNFVEHLADAWRVTYVGPLHAAK